ncbi:MAG: ATP-binding protein [Candidatus Dadabacteria bacterium]|nr:ATP-binding protein [Candidatus Dadabacteria bacterium]
MFDTEQELPSAELTAISESLIGFNAHYSAMKRHLALALMPDRLDEWSQKFYKKRISLCDVVRQRYPLFLLSGDVGTGKTVTAECAANRVTDEMKKEGFLLKLSTRVRGQGLHGEMSQLIQEAFENLSIQAGKKRLSFLIIDEADSIASLRSTQQMHQEEKAAVNTLIQKIDNIRSVGGRAVVFLCTNRPSVIDQAIVRRTALHIEFERPDQKECLELLKHDLEGTSVTCDQLKELALLTSPDGLYKDLGYTFSDFRLRFFPEALVRAYPDEELSFEILKDTVSCLSPSPRIT